MLFISLRFLELAFICFHLSMITISLRFWCDPKYWSSQTIFLGKLKTIEEKSWHPIWYTFSNYYKIKSILFFSANCIISFWYNFFIYYFTKKVICSVLPKRALNLMTQTKLFQTKKTEVTLIQVLLARRPPHVMW